MPGKIFKKLLKKIKGPKTYKVDGKVIKELPDGRSLAKDWVKNNPGRSLKGTSKDFEVGWKKWLNEKGFLKNKKNGGAVGPNGIL